MLGISGLKPEEYAISANAVLGIRDSGKTYTATKAAEELYDNNIPFIALDPIGVWASLRVPGKGKGYPVVVAGGRHADLPLTVKNCGTIVRAAMEGRVALVLDLFDRDMSKADWRRIVKETCDVLLIENVDYGLRHVFIEEASEFVPQRMMDGHVFSAVEKLVKMGGNSKVGCTLINQRSADLNKSVLELCANAFVHRQKGKNTLMDLRKWFDMLELTDREQDQIGTSLPNLKSGQCWALLDGSKSPIKVTIPEKNSQHPDRRAAQVTEANKRKPVDAAAFVQAMRDRLTEKPVKLQPGASMTVKAGAQTIEVRSATPAQLEAARREGAQAVLDQLPTMLDEQHRASFMIGVEWGRGAAILAAKAIPDPTGPIPNRRPIKAAPAKIPARPASSTPQAPSKAPSSTSSQKANGSGDPGLTGPQRTMLGVLAWWDHMGHREPTKAQVAAVAGWAVKAGHIRNISGQLKSAGLIKYPHPGHISLTTTGAASAPDPDMGSATLIGGLRSTLTGPQVAVFDTLLRHGRRKMSKDALCEELNWDASAGHIRNILGQMRSMEILSRARGGDVELQEWVQ